MFYRLPCDDRSPCAGVATARNSAWILAATILGSAMPGIDSTAVNVALPVLQRDLHAGADATQWVVEGYSLFLSALILAGGSLGDRLGRRRLFLTGVVIFAAASAACAISQTIVELIAARCVQGIGGALLVPESLAIITASFDERERGAAIGTWSGFLAATMAIGPLLGGWLVQALSWRLIFVINLPIALAIILIASWCIDESRDESRGRGVDVIGAILATAALGLLTYGLIDLQDANTQRTGVAAIAAGVVALLLFVYAERRSAEPMIPLGIFAARDFTIANVYTFFLYAALGGALFFIPFDLINVRHYTPLAAGAALLPMIALMFVSSRWAGGLVTRVGARVPLTLGALAAGGGFAILAFCAPDGPYWSTFFPGILVLGIGTSTFVAPLTTTVMNSAPREHAGSASGINNAVSRVAGLLAIAVLGIVLVVSTHHALNRSGASLPSSVRSALANDSLLSGRAPQRGVPPPLRAQVQSAVESAYHIGFRDVMLVCALLAGASGVLAALTLGPRRFVLRSPLAAAE